MKMGIVILAILLVLGFCSNQVSAQEIFVPPTMGIDNAVAVVGIVIPDKKVQECP